VKGVGELDVPVALRSEEQLAFTDTMSEETVLLSESTWKVEPVFFD
jgi:hypothetical protein